ncbi:transposase, partial [Cellulosimicrobium funkei]|uniref:transposase n=1 Tax=Cellulosimicrobium funkei TaxID=264251 RepID=UPI0036F4EDF0
MPVAPLLALSPASPAASACRHPRYEETASPIHGSGARASNQRSANASGTGDTTFSIIIDWGLESYRGRRPGAPLRGHENGNGAPQPGARTLPRRPASKIHLACDALGRPLAFTVTGGNTNDCTQFTAVMDAIRVP